MQKKLTEMQHYVTRCSGTEPPFQNAYWDHHEEGIYVDVISGIPLFASTDKFDSGTGWPSFVRPIAAQHVKEHGDDSHGMQRVEVRAKQSDAHLGHLFPDGPRDRGGMRYCINSAALRFIAIADMEKEGYKDYLEIFNKE